MDDNELTQLYKSWTTEDLVRAASFDRADYLPEALAAMEKELSSRDISIDRAPIEQDIRKERQETEERLRGVRGWLLLYVIIVFVISLIGVLQSLHMLGGYISSTTALLILPWLLLSLYGFLVFVLLVRKHKKAPSHAAKWLIASACYAILIGVLIFLRTGEMTPAPFFPAMGAIVLLAYLERSRRVALTYLKESPMSNQRVDRTR